jgi:pimeloyl-ACP methyl ester carboxylesterase
MPISNEIYYHIYEGSGEGQRPPVVLIHGAGCTHLYWPSELRRLPGYRVYAPDLPGHGKSGGRGQQSILAYADELLDWLTSLGLHSAVFVGHSMGSAIILSLALNHPEHVLGLVLIGGGARLRVAPVLLEGAAQPTTFQNVIETIVSWSFSPQAPAQLVELAKQNMAETRPSVLHSDLLACDAFDKSEHISEIRQPTLIICGEDDKMTPLRSSQFLSSSIANATLEIIPHAGHMVMLEQPQAVAEALARFLSSISF